MTKPPKAFVRRVLSTQPCVGLEMADQNVTLKTLEQICDRLKCSISELFGED